MDNTKSAESAYDLTLQISETISQLGVSGDPVVLQDRLTELNRQQIENVKKTVLPRIRNGATKDRSPQQSPVEDESQVFKDQTNLLKRIFNR
ncbi:hypothetical protein FLL45_00270 [Aliikangiella marina]|uniref:Uncharacterized protein n=1 Tax=Aliikangiella marina TaxID=1712262 RepID=A0A545TGW5_9GAMM|nr:hypothetical protein [Aliikangiella marina]TQV76436.1 hypothetical protein FLL45_00270 [Aliikangiella marina]